MSAGSPTQALGYRPTLDGLRAVGIALVVLVHYCGVAGGYLGVDLFFVLSGFLITTLLLEERDGFGSVSLSRFYRRRALRLVPALAVLLGFYVALIVVGVVSDHHFVDESVVWRQVAYGATYTMNLGLIWDSLPAQDLKHLWSLAMEEQFYLVWPAVLVALGAGTGRVRRAGPLVAAAVVAVVAVRTALAPAHPTTLDAGSVTRFDSILVGCVAAFARRHAPGWTRRAGTPATAAVAAAAMAVLVVVARPSAPYDGLLTAFDVAAAVCLLGVLDGQGPLARGLALRPVVFVGQISYALYLWHRPAIIFAGRAHLMDRLGVVPGKLVALAASVAVATLSYRLVERRFLRRKRRLARASSHDAELVVPGPALAEA
ncbi:MAG TPA: acyltransferase [Solirubrobacteraceae bacterium]|nr:acyltransferase [Solirubrobacteraceae bacterium]